MGKVWEWITGGASYLLAGLKTAAGGLVARVLGAFGLSVVTFNSVLPDLKLYLNDFLQNLPAPVLQLASAVGLDIAMTMIVSALTVRMAWSVMIVPTSVKNQLSQQ